MLHGACVIVCAYTVHEERERGENGGGGGGGGGERETVCISSYYYIACFIVHCIKFQAFC